MDKKTAKDLKVVNYTFGDKTFMGDDGKLVTIPSSGVAYVVLTGEDDDAVNIGGLRCIFRESTVVLNSHEPFPEFDGKTIYIVNNNVYDELKHTRSDVFRCGGDNPVSFIYCD